MAVALCKGKYYYLCLMRLLFPTFLILVVINANAQINNLVPNPSFEEYDSCPNYQAEIFRASPWFQATQGTCDYFNVCCMIPPTSDGVGVPSNMMGFQYARTGSAYSGLVLLMFINTTNEIYREYIETKLLSPLISGKTYCVQFYVSRSNTSTIVTDSIGVYFSQDSVIDNTSITTLVYPNQIENPTGNYLSDTVAWMEVSGQFIAAGGENFMTIGNFNGNNPADFAYYYLDDVSVYSCDETVYVADAGENPIICKGDSVQIGSHNYNDYLYEWQPSTGLSNSQNGLTYVQPDSTTTYYLKTKDFKFTETQDSITVTVVDCNKNNFVITPNGDGYNDYFILPVTMNSSSLIIYNRWGQCVFEKEQYQNNWDAGEVLAGLYFFVANSQSGSYSKGIIQVIK